MVSAPVAPREIVTPRSRPPVTLPSSVTITPDPGRGWAVAGKQAAASANPKAQAIVDGYFMMVPVDICMSNPA
ncbi:hypothetical protein FHU13_000799 [Methylobacterium sp. R2-1]|nr:hypothetical protein [Methylobacterium sp. R2-1]